MRRHTGTETGEAINKENQRSPVSSSVLCVNQFACSPVDGRVQRVAKRGRQTDTRTGEAVNTENRRNPILPFSVWIGSPVLLLQPAGVCAPRRASDRGIEVARADGRTASYPVLDIIAAPEAGGGGA
jgi:hypothetical protein